MIKQAEFHEHKWPVLLGKIAECKVVPVLGPELLIAHGDNGKSFPFYSVVQQKAAKQLGLHYAPTECLADFITRASTTPKRNISREDVVYQLAEAIQKMECEDQPVLNSLAQLCRFFPLFLTTTPDNLLERALEKSGMALNRGCLGATQGLKTDWRICAFSKYNTDFRDLPGNLQPGCCYTYHLYGKAEIDGSPREFAADEDDRLKYAHEWMRILFREPNKIQNLLDYLKGKDLLLLGCGFENWMTRFFLYGLSVGIHTTNNFISIPNSFLADLKSKKDKALGQFLSRNNGSIYYEGESNSFIHELKTRIEEGAIRPVKVKTPKFEKGMVFISYAHEDRPKAIAVKNALEAKNIPVWFDGTKLESGQDFWARIESNIAACSVFMPLMSTTTTNSQGSCVVGRAFRNEWEIAKSVLASLPETRKERFIFPVCVDGSPTTPDVPAHIAGKQWANAPGGNLNDTDLSIIDDWVLTFKSRAKDLP